MSKKVLCLFAFVFILGFVCFTNVNAASLAQADLAMGLNYAASKTFDLTESREVHVLIKSGAGSQSHLRYDIESLQALPIPGKDPILIPQTVKSDFVAPGQEETFTITLKPGKYRITLHSDEGNCEGSGTLS